MCASAATRIESSSRVGAVLTEHSLSLLVRKGCISLVVECDPPRVLGRGEIVG